MAQKGRGLPVNQGLVAGWCLLGVLQRPRELWIRLCLERARTMALRSKATSESKRMNGKQICRQRMKISMQLSEWQSCWMKQRIVYVHRNRGEVPYG
jgi:hypothetical protein